ncbi:MAG: Lycopene cyclase [uncultured Sphingomonadaceae bacterium]|uniref:Lycopene cyclase n=1 Tax=uncultured Sphingomonadaceae bacterium TaxID=169976 RepID=A0A6J4SSS1_9SPHN|nr:MAG: Lycopene cyclase [uncultured Sphingomonadaceae bacterium]
MTTRRINGLVIAGGGLAGCLVALALRRWRPEVPFLLVEGAETFGGDHLWSFFDTDVAPRDRALVEPLVEHYWDGCRVTFPERRRTFGTGYNSIPSARLDRVVREALPVGRYLLGAPVVGLGTREVLLEGGDRIVADAVLDARGVRGAADFAALDCGWQKFVGREYVFDRPHGIDLPVIMDAAVDQADGYRFVYLLPFDEHRLFVEDTYYHLNPQLDVVGVGERIDAYVAARGFGPGRVAGQETGVLAMPLGGDFDAFWRAGGERVGKLGVRGGMFQPLTSYSLPDAVRVARLVAEQPGFDGHALHDLLRDHAARLWRERGFYRTLNVMLLRAADPPDRYRVLEHFYRLDAPLISRFYAGESTLIDKMRVLTGRPPVPVTRALSALRSAR